MKRNYNQKGIAKILLTVMMIFSVMFTSFEIPVSARGGSHSSHSSHSSSHSSSSHSSKSSSPKAGYSSGGVSSPKVSKGFESGSSAVKSSDSGSGSGSTGSTPNYNTTVINNYHSSGYSPYYTPGFSFHMWSHPVYYSDDDGVIRETYAGPSILGYIFDFILFCLLIWLIYYLISRYINNK